MPGVPTMPYTYDFPRPSVAVDTIVLSGAAPPRVLLIRRRGEPFAGAWALPGGYVNQGECLDIAARRELEEATGLRVDTVKQFLTVGDPGRDPRGWTVSVVHVARVGDPPPEVKAGDDAADARWFPIDQLPRLAFDHEAILKRWHAEQRK